MESILEFNCEKKQILIGQIALIQQSKRQDVVIDTVEYLRKIGYDAHALLVGQIRADNIEYAEQLKRSVLFKGLSDAIHFMGHRNDVPNILKAIDVLMIPSVEGLPLAGLEAIASGKPIVANVFGGTGELIEISKAGYCFADGNISQAARMILKAIDNSNNNQFLINGKRFTELCSYANYSKNIMTVFKGVDK